MEWLVVADVGWSADAVEGFVGVSEMAIEEVLNRRDHGSLKYLSKWSNRSIF